MNSMSRRGFLILVGLIPFSMRGIFAETIAMIAPCAFSFDASHAGVVVTGRFSVRERRRYKITLSFFHKGGEDAENLRKLLDSQEALYLTDSLKSTSPIKVTYENFMGKGSFSSSQERSAALTEAAAKYDEAVREAIRSRFDGVKYEYSYVPQNKKGLIPLSVRLSEVESDREESLIFEKKLDTLGMESGGGGKFTREIFSADLRPGKSYELTVKALRDSPLFFDREMKIGVIFDPRLQ